MHDDHALVEQRLHRVLTERLRPARHPHRTPCHISVWHPPGHAATATEALAADYRPTTVGQPWGAAWSTTWFRVTATVPPQWAGSRVEALVDLGFDTDRPGFCCEGLVYDTDATPIKGLHPRNHHIPVTRAATGGETVTFHIEAAANPLLLGASPLSPFHPTTLGDPDTVDDTPLYALRRAEIAVLDETTDALIHDIDVLHQLARHLHDGTPRRAEILRALDTALDLLDLDDIPATAAAARAAVDDVLTRPAHASAHHITAVGHAHLDTAWLWPLAETVRKTARTIANAAALADEDPQFVFAFSQAQQLAWLHDHYPHLFDRVRHHVHTGQFVPVGGMWVEADTNLPGGEALARQLVHGKRFFRDHLGVDTHDVWLPDSFGYSAALPQLIAASGSRYFLTQKLSWNDTNRFPHHTFWWEGLDGTRVFTHCPPADTYNAEITPGELDHATRRFAEHGAATRSLLPFGHGNGGGGPTREMLARAHRLADCEGAPRLHLGSPTQFFRDAETDHRQPAVWRGELYLERHRGTYTTQNRTKQGNRRGEHLLREAELWCTTAAVIRGSDYPYDTLDRLWKQLLLHQFHDILPGTSIAWVHRDTHHAHQRLAAELDTLITEAVHALAGAGERVVEFNAAPHRRHGVPAFGAAPPAPPRGAATAITDPHTSDIVLDNGHIRATIDPHGTLTSVHDHTADRELLPPGHAANVLQLHPDHPAAWDAWDIDAHYRHTHTDLTTTDDITTEHPDGGGVTVRVTRHFGSSHAVQRIHLRPDSHRLDFDCHLDWHETEKLLKVTFPLDIHAEHSSAETQYGHLRRPTHTNTSWQAAQFETCAHRWLHIGETGYGAALINDSTYGHDVTRTTRPGGGTTTTARLSLLRAPRFPDPHTDHGPHHLRYALHVGATVGDAIREGYHLNLPPRTAAATHPVTPLITCDHDAVILEAVKLADDRSGDVIVRAYEALGGRAHAHLTPSFAHTTATRTDLLERPLPDGDTTSDNGVISLRLRPFEIATLRLARTTP